MVIRCFHFYKQFKKLFINNDILLSISKYSLPSVDLTTLLNQKSKPLIQKDKKKK